MFQLLSLSMASLRLYILQVVCLERIAATEAERIQKRAKRTLTLGSEVCNNECTLVRFLVCYSS